jgi:hypothetical protein
MERIFGVSYPTVKTPEPDCGSLNFVENITISGKMNTGFADGVKLPPGSKDREVIAMSCRRIG